MAGLTRPPDMIVPVPPKSANSPYSITQAAGTDHPGLVVHSISTEGGWGVCIIAWTTWPWELSAPHSPRIYARHDYGTMV